MGLAGRPRGSERRWGERCGDPLVGSGSGSGQALGAVAAVQCSAGRPPVRVRCWLGAAGGEERVECFLDAGGGEVALAEIADLGAGEPVG